MGLTTKQRRFVEEYIGPANFNAAEAARRAGYSEKTARAIGSENLSKPDIAKAIEDRLNELSMSAAEVTKRLTDWGRGSIGHFQRITATGEVVTDLSTKEAQDHLHLIREIQVEEIRQNDEFVTAKTKIKLHDAKDATVQLGKIRGLYVDRVEGKIEFAGVLRVPGVDPGKWREAAAGNRLQAERNGHRNGTG